MLLVPASLDGGCVMKLMFAATGLSLLMFAAAHADQNEDNLQAMYMLKASQEICDFPMGEAESAKLQKASALLEKKLGYDASKATTFYGKVKAAVEAQKTDLCKPDGDWSKTYNTALAGLPD